MTRRAAAAIVRAHATVVPRSRRPALDPARGRRAFRGLKPSTSRGLLGGPSAQGAIRPLPRGTRRGGGRRPAYDRAAALARRRRRSPRGSWPPARWDRDGRDSCGCSTYELRCWRGGSIRDLASAVGGARRLITDPEVARRLLHAVATMPTPVGADDPPQPRSSPRPLRARRHRPRGDRPPPTGTFGDVAEPGQREARLTASSSRSPPGSAVVAEPPRSGASSARARRRTKGRGADGRGGSGRSVGIVRISTAGQYRLPMTGSLAWTSWTTRLWRRSSRGIATCSSGASPSCSTRRAGASCSTTRTWNHPT